MPGRSIERAFDGSKVSIREESGLGKDPRTAYGPARRKRWATLVNRRSTRLGRSRGTIDLTRDNTAARSIVEVSSTDGSAGSTVGGDPLTSPDATPQEMKEIIGKSIVK